MSAGSCACPGAATGCADPATCGAAPTACGVWTGTVTRTAAVRNTGPVARDGIRTPGTVILTSPPDLTREPDYTRAEVQAPPAARGPAITPAIPRPPQERRLRTPRSSGATAGPIPPKRSRPPAELGICAVGICRKSNSQRAPEMRRARKGALAARAIVDIQRLDVAHVADEPPPRLSCRRPRHSRAWSSPLGAVPPETHGRGFRAEC